MCHGEDSPGKRVSLVSPILSLKTEGTERTRAPHSHFERSSDETTDMPVNNDKTANHTDTLT